MLITAIATTEQSFEAYYQLALHTAYRYRYAAFENREDLQQSAALAALEALQPEANEPVYSTINRVLYRETVNRGWRCCEGQWQYPEAGYENWTEIEDDGAADFVPNELDQLNYQLFASIYTNLSNYYGSWTKAVTTKARFLVRQAERTTDYQQWLTLRQASIICRLYVLFEAQGVAAAWLFYEKQFGKIETKDANQMLLDYPAFRALYREIIIKSRYDRAEAKVAAQLLMSEAIDQQQQAGKTETGTILAMTMFRLYVKYGSEVDKAWAELAEIGFAIGDELHPIKAKSTNADKAQNKEVVAA